MGDKSAAPAVQVSPRARDSTTSPPLAPKHQERICWGCNKYCPEYDLACGNGTIRTPHPIELFGEDWLDWSEERPDTRHR